MIVVDTGYFLALADADDNFHTRALGWAGSVSEGWATTWPVVTETSYLLASRFGEAAKTDFLQEVFEGHISMWEIPLAQARKIPAMIKKYANLPMDLADASLVLLAEHLGHGRILTTDQRDFGAYRWKSAKPFHNLLDAGDSKAKSERGGR